MDVCSQYYKLVGQKFYFKGRPLPGFTIDKPYTIYNVFSYKNVANLNKQVKDIRFEIRDDFNNEWVFSVEGNYALFDYFYDLKSLRKKKLSNLKLK